MAKRVNIYRDTDTMEIWDDKLPKYEANGWKTKAEKSKTTTIKQSNKSGDK